MTTATVVGGGPAGLMAAEVLAGAGLTVTVFEHNRSVGRKLLLAGRSGLNLTHNEPFDDLLMRYGPAAPRLHESLSAFDAGRLRHWCESLGQPTFVGSTGRVFPEAMRAAQLLRAWLARLADCGVALEVGARWQGWASDGHGGCDPRRLRFERRNGIQFEVVSDVTVLALGGASWPRVGSDGGWVNVLRAAGVAVNDLRPANCGVLVDWSPGFVERFEGMPLKNVAIAAGDAVVRGDATVTRGGLEGSPVYALSAAIRNDIDSLGQCRVTIDLQPDLDADRLTDRLRSGRSKDSLSTSLRRTIGLSKVAIALLSEAATGRPPSDPSELATLVKAVPFAIIETMPIARAISSAGGVSFDAVNGSLMLDQLPGTFVAGEMLDWEAPTGGYLLQATFSTAVSAARGAISWLSQQPDQRGCL
ncbi:MAG: TIGR03862 family flavoprotein [Ilumatobacteraceae bacterium]